MNAADREWLKELADYLEQILKIHDELFLLDKVYIRRKHAEDIIVSLRRITSV